LVSDNDVQLKNTVLQYIIKHPWIKVITIGFDFFDTSISVEQIENNGTIIFEHKK